MRGETIQNWPSVVFHAEQTLNWKHTYVLSPSGPGTREGQESLTSKFRTTKGINTLMLVCTTGGSHSNGLTNSKSRSDVPVIPCPPELLLFQLGSFPLSSAEITGLAVSASQLFPGCGGSSLREEGRLHDFSPHQIYRGEGVLDRCLGRSQSTNTGRGYLPELSPYLREQVSWLVGVVEPGVASWLPGPL